MRLCTSWVKCPKGGADTMKQVTLVALYGKKPRDLEQLIKKCWQMINDSKLRRVFEQYHLNQVHGTITGMEKVIDFDELFNASEYRETGNKVIMQYNELPNIVRKHLPMTIRFGGFPKNYKKFKSWKKLPYEQSFRVDWGISRFTLVGWSHKNGNFTNKHKLEELRLEIEKSCNIRHKYHRDKEYKDFYMVLGEIKGLQSLTDSELRELKCAASASLEESIRQYLLRNRIDVEIGAEQVFLAQYEKETLSLDSTNAYCIQSPRINGDFIAGLYS